MIRPFLFYYPVFKINELRMKNKRTAKLELNKTSEF